MHNAISKKLLLTTAIASTLVATNGLTQTSNINPGVIDRATPNTNVPKSYNLLNSTSPKSKINPAKFAEADSDAAIPSISNVVFEGNTTIDEAMLQETAAPYLNQPLTKGDLARLKYDLTKTFYDAGFILVKVTTPPQSLEDGSLKVAIHEATIGEIIVHNDDILYPPLAKNIANQLKRGSVFSENAAETVISDLDDLNNITASMNLRPGKVFKTTDLHVYIDEASNQDDRYFSIDNYGAELTGDHVASIYLEKSNVLGLGETVFFSGRKSDGDLDSARLGFTMPTGIYGIHFDSELLYTDSELGKQLAPLEITGQTNAIDLSLFKNFINTNTEKLTATLGMDFRTHKSSLAGVRETRDKIRQVYAEASYLIRLDSAVLFGATRVIKGTSLFDATDAGQPFATVAEADPDAWRVQPTIIANWAPIDGGILKLYSTAQIASDTLLSSDLFAIGGYGSVRGFEPAEETGETGYIVNLEYLHDIPVNDSVIVNVGPWIDAGAVFSRQQGNNTDNHLYAAGIGLEITSDIIPFVEDTTIRLDWARTLGDYNDTSIEDNNTFYFRITQNF